MCITNDYEMRVKSLAIEYGVPEADISHTVSKSIASVCGFLEVASIIDTNTAIGYRNKNGSLVFGKQKLSDSVRKKIVDVFEKEIEKLFKTQKTDEIMLYTSHNGGLIECEVVGNDTESYILKPIKYNGGFIQNTLLSLPKSQKFTLDKDVRKKKYEIGNRFFVEILFDLGASYKKGNWLFTCTRKSNLIIQKHLRNIENALLANGIRLHLSVQSVSFSKNIVYIKRDGFVKVSATNFIEKCLGFNVKFVESFASKP